MTCWHMSRVNHSNWNGWNAILKHHQVYKDMFSGAHSSVCLTFLIANKQQNMIIVRLPTDDIIKASATREYWEI